MTYHNLEDTRLGVFHYVYIETFYNPVRLHQTLGDLSRDQYEAEHARHKWRNSSPPKSIIPKPSQYLTRGF